MNITFNTETIGLLLIEIEDILCNADISAGTSDDLSSFLNALAGIGESGSIVIVLNDDNIDDSWDDGDDSPHPVNPPIFTPA